MKYEACMSKCLVLLIVVIFACIAPTKTFAHTLQSSGSVGAVMHVTPEDDPVAGEQSEFFFEFKDTTNTFSPETCDCTISVQASGSDVLSKPLFSDNTVPSLTHASFSYTFPHRGLYSIVVTGKPIRGGLYKQFRLVYDIRVEREKPQNMPHGSNQLTNQVIDWISTHSIHALPIVVSVLFIGWIVLDKRKSKEQ